MWISKEKDAISVMAPRLCPFYRVIGCGIPTEQTCSTFCPPSARCATFAKGGIQPQLEPTDLASQGRGEIKPL